jgi:hypothetical protein
LGLHGLPKFSTWPHPLLLLSLFQLQEQLYVGISFTNHNGLQNLYGFSHNIHGQWNRNNFSLKGPNLGPF